MCIKVHASLLLLVVLMVAIIWEHQKSSQLDASVRYAYVRGQRTRASSVSSDRPAQLSSRLNFKEVECLTADVHELGNIRIEDTNAPRNDRFKYLR